MADDKPGAGDVSDAMSSRGLAGKRDYVRTLEQRRDDESVSLLVQCLCDESGYLRELAEEALLRIGERSGPALLPLLGQGLWCSRTSAARVLGRMGYAPAAGPLLRLTEDSVETVVREAYASLHVLGQRGATVRVAWELHRLAPEQRQARLARLLLTDRRFAARLQRLMTTVDLMSQVDPDALRDDSALVRASEEGGTWDRIGDPPSTRPGSPATGAATTPVPTAHGPATATR